jgi:hypoxanthine phosphoribosyltransferase
VTPDEARQMLAEADLICSEDEVHLAVGRVAREIAASLRDSFPMVLSVMGGAAVFTGNLLPLLDFPMEFGAIEVTRYRNTTQGREINWRLTPRDDVKGRTVLVIDDILDQGVTLSAVRDRLQEMGAARVWTAVFCDKELGIEKPIKADFTGVTVPDRYVFGFGMDAYGLWRNLPAVYALKGK